MGICFTVNIYFLGTKYDANLEIISCQVLFYQPLHVHQDPENNPRVPFKIQISRTSRLSRSASIHVHVDVQNG